VPSKVTSQTISSQGCSMFAASNTPCNRSGITLKQGQELQRKVLKNQEPICSCRREELTAWSVTQLVDMLCCNPGSRIAVRFTPIAVVSESVTSVACLDALTHIGTTPGSLPISQPLYFLPRSLSSHSRYVRFPQSLGIELDHL
jgi:hypothetical protein